MGVPEDLTPEEKKLYYKGISSQGATVSFDGSNLGNILSISYSGGDASPVDIGGLSTKTEGGDPFVVRRYDLTIVDPGSCSITFFGTNSAGLRRGMIGQLTVRIGKQSQAVSFSGEAIVTRCDTEVAVGDFVRGSASFTFTGR